MLERPPTVAIHALPAKLSHWSSANAIASIPYRVLRFEGVGGSPQRLVCPREIRLLRYSFLWSHRFSP